MQMGSWDAYRVMPRAFTCGFFFIGIEFSLWIYAIPHAISISILLSDSCADGGSF